MPKGSDSNYDPAKWTVQSIDNPFKLYRIQNVFANRQYVIKLKEELEKLEFSHNMNDIFSLYQTKDLAYLKNSTKFPMLQKFRKFLHEFKIILSQELNSELESTISVSSSIYNKQDFLLCHDDNLEDRYVAFIYYLNPTWETKWGGSLDIFDHDDKGQPSRIIHSIYPDFNSLIFFKVGNVTYHQVAEVVSDEASRITINGWFHSKEALSIRPLMYQESPVPFLKTHDRGALIYLHHFVNNDFLRETSSSLISENFGEKNVIMLQSFLKPKIFDKISEELKSNSVRWVRKGPANRRRYDIANIESLPKLTAAFLTYLQSKYICSYMESISGCDLFQISDELHVGLVHAEIQSWKSSYYSLLSDSDVQFDNNNLEMWLFFNVEEETKENEGEQPGNIYYCKKNGMVAECEIQPANNSICLVRKRVNETMFVSYISAKSTLSYHALRVSFKMSENLK